MDKPIAEFKINRISMRLYFLAVLVPIIIFKRLLEYNLFLAIIVTLLVVLYEFWVIKSEINLPFKIYEDRFEGRLNGNLIKLNTADIKNIKHENGYMVIYDQNHKLIMKIKEDLKTKEFIIFISRMYHNKIVAD